MLTITPKHKVYFAVHHIDFRKGLDAIIAQCRQQFNLDPFNGHYYIFRNRKRSAIKILAYDAQGFWLCYKRLSKGLFRYWPKTSHSIVMLSPAQLQVLLQNGNPATVNSDPPWRLISD